MVNWHPSRLCPPPLRGRECLAPSRRWCTPILPLHHVPDRRQQRPQLAHRLLQAARHAVQVRDHRAKPPLFRFGLLRPPPVPPRPVAPPRRRAPAPRPRIPAGWGIGGDFCNPPPPGAVGRNRAPPHAAMQPADLPILQGRLPARPSVAARRGATRRRRWLAPRRAVRQEAQRCGRRHGSLESPWAGRIGIIGYSYYVHCRMSSEFSALEACGRHS
jgi:hypothetical protein